MDDPVEGLAPEPSSLGSLQLDLAQPKSGVEEVLDEAATARAQARHMTLSTDAEGALNMLKHLEALPNLKSYDALRAGLYGAKVRPQPCGSTARAGCATCTGGGVLPWPGDQVPLGTGRSAACCAGGGVPDTAERGPGAGVPVGHG